MIRNSYFSKICYVYRLWNLGEEYMVNDNYSMVNDNEMEYEICNDFVIKC